MNGNALKRSRDKVFAIAPMMDWTDRHCRFFHRLLTRHGRLYSEMIVADAIIYGDRDYLLAGNDCVKHVALQLGGSDPKKLAQATSIAMAYGYDEINLNVGCPSGRVQSGAFGACLMYEPQLVGECVRAIKEAAPVPVTVKCRIGVDNQDMERDLDIFASAVWESGCDGLWVHARKAWLKGLNPKENRDVPPLDYERVYRLKAENTNQFIGLNGGVGNLNQCVKHLREVDGVMMGRAAYQNPALLRHVDQELFDEAREAISYSKICTAMCEYAEKHLIAGGKLNQITRHMIGLFHGKAGAQRYRRLLSVEANAPGVGPEVIGKAFEAVESAAFSPM